MTFDAYAICNWSVLLALRSTYVIIGVRDKPMKMAKKIYVTQIDMYVTQFMQWTDHDKQKLSLVFFSIV